MSTRTHYQGGYSGVSVKVAKGVYYRTGGFKGHPVKTSEMILKDGGILGITNKHIYFSGTKSFFSNAEKMRKMDPERY